MFLSHSICKIIQNNLSRNLRTFSLRRAILYVPGDDERKILKSQKLDVDCIALDCEDGVAINRKSAARETIHKFFNSNKHIKTEQPNSLLKDTTEWSVRINSVDSGEADEDLRCILASSKLPTTLLLPKVESTDDLDFFNETLRKYLQQNIENKNHIFELIFYTESCKSLLNLSKICQHAQELSAKYKHFKPSAIVCGGDDMVASLGAQKTLDANELNYARQHCVLVAKAYKLQAIDIVFIEYKNADGLQKQSLQGANWGYTGKQIIHPNQIETVQNAFLPNTERVKWAREVLAAFENHQKSGKGAFSYQNTMIDMPTVKQAKNIIKTIDRH